MTPDRALAIVVSYIAVACIAWTYGYVSRVWIERHGREGDPVLDLTDPPFRAAYDWQIDGECVREVSR